MLQWRVLYEALQKNLVSLLNRMRKEMKLNLIFQAATQQTISFPIPYSQSQPNRLLLFDLSRIPLETTRSSLALIWLINDFPATNFFASYHAVSAWTKTGRLNLSF